MGTAVEAIDLDALLSPGAVARLFHVTPKTISRWSEAGLLVAERTPGGHRRFRARTVYALLDALEEVGAP